MFLGLLFGVIFRQTISCILLAVSDFMPFGLFIAVSFASFGCAGIGIAAGYVSALSIAASEYTEISD